MPRPYALALLFIFCLTLQANPQDKPSPEELLQAVHKNADLSQNGPYVLTATVVVNPGDKKRERSGRLTIYRDHDRARTELQMPDFQEVRVMLGDKTYAGKGQFVLFATTLQNFDQSWDPTRSLTPLPPAGAKFGRVEERKVNGRDAFCFDRHGADGVCIDASEPLLLDRGAGDKNKMEFFDYGAAGKQIFPRRVAIHKDLMSDLEVGDVAISFHPLEDSLFSVPTDSIETGRCDGMKPPKAVFTPEPEFPEKARHDREQATVLLCVNVGADGKVPQVKALSNTGNGFERNAEAAVRTWKFKPATCNGRPVGTEMTVEVAFRLF